MLYILLGTLFLALPSNSVVLDYWAVCRILRVAWETSAERIWSVMKKIEAKNLSFAYHEKEAVLKNIFFQAEEGETIGLIGANGVGKSTMLKLLVGILTEYRGELSVCGMSVEKENLAQIREKIGYVFQDSDSQLFMSTIYEDVSFAPRNYGYSEQEVEERVQAALSAVHIEKIQKKQIYRLSGGEKKLASIATILSMKPEIILLDEPSVALDPRNRRNLIYVLKELPGTKIIASHDLDLIFDICDRTILLSDGKIVRDGDSKILLTDQVLLEQHGLELPLSMQYR